MEIYNWLGTAPVPAGGCRYWRSTGIILGGKRLGTGIRLKCYSAGSCLSVLGTAPVPKICIGAVL